MASFKTMSNPKLVNEYRLLTKEHAKYIFQDKTPPPAMIRQLEAAEQEIRRRHLEVNE